MIFLIYGGILLAALFILAWPFLRGSVTTGYFEASDKLKNVTLNKEQSIKDKIESTKLELRDLDMENKIGKIAHEDFDVLKDELLEEWKTAEKEYSDIKKSHKKTE